MTAIAKLGPKAYLMGMTTRPTPIERAFELANSGTCASVAEIRAKLKSEGLADSQITGPSLLKQLRGLVAAARPDGVVEDVEEDAEG